MATVHTFFLEPANWHAPFTLQGAEAHHLSRVLRVRKGETVRLLDGQGRLGFFSVASIEKNHVLLSLEQEELTPRPPACTLAAGYSKALRRGWFLEKAVELEAGALWFWQGDYSQASLPDTEKEAWQGSLVAGAKQSVNPWLPHMESVAGGAAAVAARAKNFDRAFLLYEGETEGRLLTQQDLAGSDSTLLVIGPEGGFSPAEVTTFIEAGIVPVSLGKRILRWETAAVLVLGMAWWARQ